MAALQYRDARSAAGGRTIGATRAARLARSMDANPDPRLDQLLRRMVLLGLALVLLLPAARESGAWLGAAPLWLLGMPLASWWALHRFRLPRWPRADATALQSRRRRRAGAVQARRRGPGIRPPRSGVADVA